MELQNIKVSLAYESVTNPRGKDFEGPAFDDLVSSVKEKGVLVPVIVRRKPKGNKEFEVIAGNRRLRAATVARLDEIPARIEELDDIQAREIQIIENLQREDISPLDEGEAYRSLIEKSRYEISAVAAKVGKPESYIRSRLFITNLTDKAKQALRNGKITIGHGLLITRLEEKQQAEALKYCLSDYTITVADLKEWIEDNIYNDLKKLPWLNDKALVEKVGSCNDCQAMKRNSLFPDKEVPKNCINPDCLKKKKTAYLELKTAKEKLVKVSSGYGSSTKGILSKSDYTVLSTKEKDHCDFTQKAIVVEGDKFGSIVYICADTKCKIHHGSHSNYALTPEEKAERKKEKEEQLKKKEKEDKRLIATLENIKWPMTKIELNVLFELTMNKYGEDDLRSVAKRHNWEPVMREEKGWGSGPDDKKTRKFKDWAKTIRSVVAMTDEQKLRLIIEIMLEGTWQKNKFIKLIKGAV